MSTQIQRRRGTTAEHSTFTGVEGELTVDTTKDTAVVHDGTTVGGHPLQKQYPPLGSAAAPTYTFTGDTNTGIYSPGADQVAVATNGTGRLFINSSGQIFATASALSSDSLNANGLGFFGGVIKQQSTSGFDFTQFYTSAGQGSPDASIFIPGSNAFGIKTAGSERLRITSAGLVGIGTSVPNHKLHIHSTGNTPAYLRSTNDGTGTGTTDGIVIGMGDATNAYLWNYENGGIVFATNATQRAVIDSPAHHIGRQRRDWHYEPWNLQIKR
jgi:hypothetical protein